VSRHVAAILGDPHIAICECRICEKKRGGPSEEALAELEHEHEHAELGPPFPSIEDLEHRENELAIDHE